ncbi:DUF58 domain-containing protein [Chitinophaga vietnamensis]|uniref:DUF58 domain-containing protein n=1 Tax=Chitinophaga vietnamensis TaxID=2593957 RepID=UPI00191BE64D|nr:DUF58 domain-containing protein [Chitinophaga vietnamensis]
MSRLLDPKTILAIKDLPLAARTVVDGFMAGIHTSRMKGAGLEFSQYRSYQPGDDLRWLDWKMYARSDRYYIRESEMETSIAVRLVIDASNSMRHQEEGIVKIEYARYLAAALGYLSHLQGDATGLSVLQQGQLVNMDPRREAQQMARFYYQLEQISSGGRFAAPAHYRDLITGTNTRQLIIFITDYYEREGEITALLQTLAAQRHEVMVFQLLGRQEREGHFTGYQAVEDLETGEIMAIDNIANGEDYTNNFNQYINALRSRLLEKNIWYRQLWLQEPLDTALRDVLNQRNKMRR